MKLKKQYITKNNKSRLYGLAIPIVGLTGGMASGKSTASTYLKKKYNFNIIDADQLIKNIYSFNSTIELVKALAPECYQEGINFRLLREVYLKDKEVEKKLQLHLLKLLPEEFRKVVVGDVVIYDAALIFEKDLHKNIDQTLLITCSEETQIHRIVARDSVTVAQAKEMLKLQLPLSEKQSRANFIISNEEDQSFLYTSLDKWVNTLFSD